MHITEVVLDNFKSFGRKTRIPFYEDFTTISGPNGSGKSNIVDAILFALGLARTSGIRAEKLTDLIYNPGHQDGQRPDGEREASVTVVLDNADGTLSRSQVENAAGSQNVGDIEDIEIRRRVKETEDNYYSYYYINGRSVNLGDIQDLLAQAGVAPEGYNVVMQGDVTEIINMTAGARREIIDEIAGVAEFDKKKEQAFAELETVQDRIDEAELRIEEKETRLEQLEDERETALEYQELKDEKDEYEAYKKAAELEDKRDDLAEIDAEIDELEATLEKRQRELDERQGKVLRLEAELEDLNAEIERKGEDEQLQLKREIEEIKGEIARLEDAVESATEKREAAETDRREAFVQIDRKQETIDDLETEIRETKVEKSSVKAEIDDLQADLAAVEEEIEEVGAEYEEVRAELDAKKADLEEAKERRNDRQREQDRLLDEARRRSNQQREIESTIESQRESIPEIDAEIDDLEDERRKARKNRETIDEVVEDLQDEKRDLQADIEEIEDDLEAARQEYAELEARAEESGDGSYGRAVTTIQKADVAGVHGPVGDLGGVDPEYADACETAAGGRLANVVVEDDGVGQRCIEHLKSRNAGRATFLPMTEMHDRSLPSPPDLPGVVDFAYNLVDFDAQYSGVFSYVLGDTLVVEDMETARDLMGEFRLVTLDGDLVEKSGAMTGGSSSGSRYSFSGGEGRLKRVAERITDLEDERTSVREELRDVEERLEDARDRRSEAAEQLREIQAEIERREREREEADERIEALESELEEIEREREDVSAQMDEIEAEIEAIEAEIEDAEATIAQLESEIEDSELPALTDEAETIRAAIDEREDELEDLDAQLNELQLENQYAEEAIEDLHDEIESAQNRKAEQDERIEELEGEIDEQEALLADKEDAVAELEAELAELKGEREELREDVRAAREARDEHRERVNAVQSELESERETQQRLQWEIEELASAVGEYDPDEIPDHHTVQTRIGQLESRMEALEPVNMLAIEEYDAVNEDLEDLQAKRETLVAEADGIRERIETYEARKKETFMDAYEAIDEHFQDIFERLSNGTGRLHLENEDDPFDGGLTMKAQPGDKPIQRLAAMSGGEKSLTALAFIFAIQRHNPAPFYALDEVDAFLDAANADLVGEMVDDLAGEAQFVVVSHRSAMLERSERAIGVTMGEDNVSAVTGIDLSDTAGEVSADD
ncbi:chromosome segregation protein SMC [Halorhabdus sp. CUG00001]|uniref:chromosome segregation protein SMC n=1 Tax=Halorhabdus sp. CUG00001 TaxID=2600297 RepID=UPI00131B6353|nr:chromosome segregation protein SMC [Halorhabdus sp. CUG00001]